MRSRVKSLRKDAQRQEVRGSDLHSKSATTTRRQSKILLQQQEKEKHTTTTNTNNNNNTFLDLLAKGVED